MKAEGLVLKSTGSWYNIRLNNREVIRCRLRGKLKLNESKTTNPVAVGDRVVVEMEKSGEGIVHEVLPRRNYFIRKSAKKGDIGHIIASNIDQAILIVTLSFPRTSIGFIDRYLVNTESFRIPAKIVFNKSDLFDDALKEMHRNVSDLYRQLGYDNILISATNDADLDSMKIWLKNKMSLVTGHSGVGKTTILNRIAPGLNLPTGEVSTFANKGIHVTTFASMFELEDNTFIIDTPGIRELGLIDMENWEISHYFPEMRDRMGECRYSNCLHLNEPGCKIQELLLNGLISESRFKSYISMVLNEDNRK
ncbi:MAG TPA: ribosome small subunit-dependent GTPase A [Cyclobacteriaceae bacterium]|nr:ribosome small subunit-dependent GTPase A [Cyclobacteriaceae bacterium]